MSCQFHAQWLNSATGEKEVSVILSTGRREFSPDLRFAGNDEVVCGIPAAHLAMVGDGEITTRKDGQRTGVQIVPGALRY